MKTSKIARTIKVLKKLKELYDAKPYLNWVYSYNLNESHQFLASLDKKGLILATKAHKDDPLTYRQTPEGLLYLENIVIWHIAFEGHIGGDWWATLRSDGVEHPGFHKLKDTKTRLFTRSVSGSIDGLHRGKFELEEYLPTNYHGHADIMNPNYFYADTLRWFATLKTDKKVSWK